ncbi:hypothetical protein BWI17_11960 [Betaproteobacteria bacterium GR16-43]|nr:hypothetical protein BWI17_11960 [Betaproteobacteria bacterium GR16-43]
MTPDQPRFDSVDALRGLSVAAMLLVNNPGDWSHVYAPLRHAKFDGCTPTDFIFPLFLFVVGVSITLARDASDRDIVLRALRIVGLGLVLHALAYLILDQPVVRIPGVLQRIGLCYGAAALFARHTRPGPQWLAIGAILLGYWAWMGWGAPYAIDGLPDPEGVASTFPAIATTLLGVRAGAWLKRGELLRIGAVGVGLLLAGEVWSQSFPMNKMLWTSSYVLWTGGWAMLGLALLDYAIDLRRWPAIGQRMGRNAIAIYAGAWILAVLLDAARWKQPIYAKGFGWLPSPEMASLAYAIAFTLAWWVVAVALDRRATYVRI